MDRNDSGFEAEDDRNHSRWPQPTNSDELADSRQFFHTQAGWLNQVRPIPLEQFPGTSDHPDDLNQRPLSLPVNGYEFNHGHDIQISASATRSFTPGNIQRHQLSVPTNIVSQPSSSSRSVYPDLDSSLMPWNGRYDAIYPTAGHESHFDRSDVDEASAVETAISETSIPTYRTPASKTVPRKTRALRPPPRPEKKRGRKKGEKRGPREVLDPGEEFNTLHAQATEAFLDKQDHETAIQCILQAISINPEIYSAHVLLSEIYFSQEENDKAIAALFSGAHAAPNDPIVWHQLADACLQKSTSSRESVLKQAAYCFSRILGIDQKDTEARFQKAAISTELGYHAKALKDLDVLQKEMPYNSDVLRQIAEVCLDLGDVTKARNLYEEALEERRSGRSSDEEIFTWSDLLVYVDLVSSADGVVIAAQTLKDISRWLVGRADELFWNSSTQDDREWDADHEPRRSQVSEFKAGQHPVELYGASLPLDLRIKLGNLRLAEGNTQEALMHFDWLKPDARGEESDVYHFPDLFLQTADSLRAFKEFQQAYRYYNALQNINAYEDVEFWLGIGACAYVCGAKGDALLYYEKAKAADSLNGEAYIQLSKLYADRGERAKAIQNARTALKLYENTVGKSQKRKYERRETREAREEAQAAFRRAYMLSPPPGEDRRPGPIPSFSRRARGKRTRAQREMLEIGFDHEDGLPPQDRLEREPRISKKRSITRTQRTQEQQEVSIRQTYTKLCDHTQAMRAGDEESRGVWLECAESLVEEFRSKKSFYPAERYKTFQGYEFGTYSKRNQTSADINTSEPGNAEEDLPLPSIENTIPNDYCGIDFSCWLEVFLEYAILLANLQYEQFECYAVITAAQDCTIWYHDAAAMTQIYTCYIVCALALQDEATLFGTALRWFMREYAFCSDVYRLFSTLNFYYPHTADKAGKSGSMSNAKFRVPPNQKFLFRHLVSLDAQLPEDYGLDTQYGPLPAFMRKERHETGLGYLKSQSNIGSHAATGSEGYGLGPTVGTAKPVEMQIHLLMLYGQILYAGGSFPNALSYFYRAMSLSPQNPVLLLTMALCYLHQMLKRQCENRHAYFLQGLALFEQYAEMRLSWAEKEAVFRRESANTQGARREDLAELTDLVRQEIAFNRARCWQMVGMADLAIRGYASMMQSPPAKREEGQDEQEVDEMIQAYGDGDRREVNVTGDDIYKAQEKDHRFYTMEAAYSMALIYASNGDIDSAKAITEKYLVVE